MIQEHVHTDTREHTARTDVVVTAAPPHFCATSPTIPSATTATKALPAPTHQ